MQVSVTDKGQILDADGKPMYELIERSYDRDTFEHVPTFGGALLMRVGFLSPVPPRHLNNPDYIHDSRPIAWPLFHPYWIVRMSVDANMVMAYVESIDDIKKYWPEAIEITVFEENVEHYRFNGNFPKPSWLDEVHHPDFKVMPYRLGAFRIYDPENDTLNIIGYSADVDYAVQLNNHQLEYGVHKDSEFQQHYDSLPEGWRNLQIEYYPTETLEEAKKKADDLTAFHTSSGEIPTSLHF